MPTKPLERLMFAQGGQCFFCRNPLQKTEASIEHLVAVTHGGKDNDENCVACCKALNSLFGRVSLKEKLQIVLNQHGHFKCPGSSAPATAARPAKAVESVADKVVAKAPRTRAEKMALVMADLQKRGNAKPGTVDKLVNTIRSHLAQSGEPANEAESLLQELAARAYVTVSENKVVYALPVKTP